MPRTAEQIHCPTSTLVLSASWNGFVAFLRVLTVLFDQPRASSYKVSVCKCVQVIDIPDSTGVSRADSFIKLSSSGKSWPPDFSNDSHVVLLISFRNGSRYS